MKSKALQAKATVPRSERQGVNGVWSPSADLSEVMTASPAGPPRSEPRQDRQTAAGQRLAGRAHGEPCFVNSLGDNRDGHQFTEGESKFGTRGGNPGLVPTLRPHGISLPRTRRSWGTSASSCHYFRTQQPLTTPLPGGASLPFQLLF